ncbi:MAG: response regulator transcription factor [Gemmatimonadetes bacterium]|nr:response regulator transcription factor [Gemmatimonadota bacterium]
MARILIIEDHVDLARTLRANLELEGHEVRVAPDGDAGLAETAWRPTLIVLDLMLPGTDGLAVLTTLRQRGDLTPVLILSARNAEVEKVRGFRLGADDYVTKPFGLMELLARVDALLRRVARPAAEAPAGDAPMTVHAFGDIRVEVESRRVFKRGAEVLLRPKEFDLLVALLRHAGRVVSRARLLREVWGYEASVVSRTVDTHLLELRRRLEDDPAQPRHLVTLRGAGYRLER